MIKKPITLGVCGEVSTVVTHNNTAIALGSGDLPVFSTPSMIALMEEASAKLLQTFLEDSASSVGTAVNIEHLSASGLGVAITATAKIQEIDGRKVVFIVTAKDENNEIGRGVHTRFIIDKAKFLAKLK
ncbi:MAG: thioesterase family protein [Firmicutes bacterium]|nr:thioesterase family protein [Bacillota bacterium]